MFCSTRFSNALHWKHFLRLLAPALPPAAGEEFPMSALPTCACSGSRLEEAAAPRTPAGALVTACVAVVSSERAVERGVGAAGRII